MRKAFKSGYPICIRTLSIYESVEPNLGALHLSTCWKSLNPTQANLYHWELSCVSPGPSVSHAQHRAQDPVEWMLVSVFILYSALFEPLVLCNTAVPSSLLLIIKSPFEAFWMCMPTCPVVSLPGVSAPSAGTWTSPSADLSGLSPKPSLFYHRNVLADLDYFGFTNDIILGYGKCLLAREQSPAEV